MSPPLPVATIRASDAERLVRRSLRWAERHVAPEVTLRDIAEAMDVSPFQLQRAFRQATGIGAMSAVRRDRLRRAAMRLAFRHGQSVTTIALDSGFASVEGFTRAFRRLVGMTPSSFRSHPDWDTWQRLGPSPAGGEADERTETELLQAWQRAVVVVTLPTFRLLGLVHAPNGGDASLRHALAAFVQWRRTRGDLHPRAHATWNLLRAPIRPGDPPTVMLAVATASRLTAADRAAGIIEHHVPRGRYARLRLEGPDALIGPAIAFLRQAWCPARSESPTGGPVLLHRLRLYPDVAEHDGCSDLHFPLSW